MDRSKKRKATEELTQEVDKKSKTVKVSLKLHDINDKCLIAIFKYLSMIDLVNIVEYDKRFIEPAKDAFSQKFINSKVSVSNEYESKTEKTTFSLNLLNHFGDQITKLKVVYGKKRKFNKLLESTINAKCHKTLLEINFENADGDTMQKITHPFEKVQIVRFVGGPLCNLVPELGKWFPNAYGLELKLMKSVPHDKDYNKAFMKHFPSLTHFAVSNADKGKRDITQRDIIQFIDLNPQITSLYVENDDRLPKGAIDFSWKRSGFDGGIQIGDDSFLRDVNEILPNLQKLHVIWKQRILYGDSHGLHFKNLKELTLEYYLSHCLFDIVTNELDVLNIIGGDLVMCHDIIKINNNAKALNISGNWCEDKYFNQMTKAAVKMPRLNELKLSYPSKGAKVDEIVSLLTGCHQLSKLTVILEHFNENDRKKFINDCKNAAAVLDEKWKIAIAPKRQLMFEKIKTNEARN